MTMLFLIGFWCICIFISYGFWKDLHFDKENVKSEKPTIPFLGNLLDVLLLKKNAAMIVHDIYQKFPHEKYFGFYEFGKHSLVLKDLNIIRDVGVKCFDCFQNHQNFIDEKYDSFFGNFLLSLNGNKWRAMRNMLSPAFTGHKLKQTFYLILECGDQLKDYFEIKTKHLKGENDYIEIELISTLKSLANDVIATTAFGLKVNTFKEPDNEIFKMGKSAIGLGDNRLLKLCLFNIFPNIMKYLEISLYDKKLKNYFRNLVKDVMTQREESGKSRPDLIQLLVEGKINKNIEFEEREWTHDELTAQAMFFFIAGYDSISHVMGFIIHELALNPDVQERVRKEIDDFDKSGKELNLENLMEMKYMDMTISEVMRLWAPVGMVDRVCQEPFTLPPPNKNSNRGYHVKVGQVVWLPIFSIQRDPENFPNPEKFDPERFSDENKALMDPFSYMPFGVGPRLCLGNRYSLIVMKVALYKVLAQFELIATEKTKMPIELDKSAFVTQSKNGYWIGLKKRNRSTESPVVIN